jgi:PAS domain S-box-containing protein
MRLLRSRLFWVVVIFFTLACVLHYSEVIGIPGTIYPSSHFGLSRHTLDRVLFLVPVIQTTFLFRRKGALISSGAALAAMLPRAILISPVPRDALLETLGIFTIGLVASWGIWSRAEERDKTEAALAKLRSSHEILQHYVQAVQKSERRQTILNTIAALLGESLELGRTLKKAVHMVAELMEVEVALIFSLDEEEPVLKVVAYEGVTEEFAQALDGVKVGDGVYGEVARTCQPMVAEAVPDDPRFTLPQVLKMKIQTQLVVPMVFKGRLRGVLCVAMRRPRQFPVEDIELLTAVGSQIAIAIENARLYEKERQVVQQLAISERKYRQLFEQASDAIWVNDLEGNITEANGAAGKLVGYRAEQLRAMNVRRFLPEETVAVTTQVWHRLLSQEPVEQPYEQRVIKRDGTEVILKLTTSLITEDGSPRGFHNIARDVTRQKRTEEMLSKITDGSPLPTFAINKEHKVTHWNIAIESLSGIKKGEIVGTDNQWQAFYNEKRPVMADLIVDGASGEEIAVFYRDKAKKSYLIDGAYEAEDFFPALGDSGRWLHFTASPIRDNSGEIAGAIETLRDVTEGRLMQERLRYYLGQITKVQEEERKRIARELHDDTTQALYALSRHVDNFARHDRNLTPEATSFLGELRQQLDDTLDGIRRFIQELRPPMLDDLGFLAALRWQLGDLEKQSGIETVLDVVGDERRFSADVELVIFRIVQEALRNVEKHAQATRVEVRIEFGEGKTEVSISDNGRGFEVGDDLAELPRAGKLGLAGMAERVRLLDGTMKIESQPGKGTRVMVEVPI